MVWEEGPLQETAAGPRVKSGETEAQNRKNIKVPYQSGSLLWHFWVPGMSFCRSSQSQRNREGTEERRKKDNREELGGLGLYQDARSQWYESEQEEII